jgi:very-short-patch-repair endonuclease
MPGRHELRGLVAQGDLRRIFHGVYVDARAEDTLDLRACAAALAVPEGSVLARQDAALVWGVPRQEPGADRRRHSLTILRPEEATGLRRSGVLGRVAVLPEQDVVSIGGLRLTSAARTLLDLARWLERPDALAYADALRRATQVGPDELHDGLDRLVGFAWVAQAREIVALSDPRAESAGESWMRLRWVDARLPPLSLQHLVEDGQRIAWLDGALSDRRFGLEYDGIEFHGLEQAAHDAERRTWLANVGWKVLAVRKAHVLGRTFGFEEAICLATGLQPRLVPWEQRRRTYRRRCLSDALTISA